MRTYDLSDDESNDESDNDMAASKLFDTADINGHQSYLMCGNEATGNRNLLSSVERVDGLRRRKIASGYGLFKFKCNFKLAPSVE